MIARSLPWDIWMVPLTRRDKKNDTVDADSHRLLHVRDSKHWSARNGRELDSVMT
jgi:hypothetical protein